jgi:invasion protein IalB
MLRVMLAAFAAVLFTPSIAHGATNATKIRGTVAVKQANRHVLVLASRHGVVQSARVTARQLRHTRIGQRLALTGKRLADRSLHVTKLRLLGSAKRARLSVVILQAKARRLLVAGGGSAFSIRLTRGTRLLAGKGSMRSGQEVKADVELSDDGLVGKTLEDAGDTPVIDFSGVVTAIGATSVTVTTDGIATVVQLPDGVVLPAGVQVGSEVEVVAAISGTTLTLEAIKLDGDNPGDDGGTDVDQGQVKVEGFVTGLDTAAGSITIQPGDSASPITFAIPTGFTLPSGIALGSVVEARGVMVDGVLTLTRIELNMDDDEQAQVEAEGTVTALDTVAGSITIQSGDSSGDDGGSEGATFTFTMPTGFSLPDGLAVGSSVEARGAIAPASSR